MCMTTFPSYRLTVKKKQLNQQMKLQLLKTKYNQVLHLACSYINTIFYVGVQLPIANVQGNGKD